MKSAILSVIILTFSTDLHALDEGDNAHTSTLGRVTLPLHNQPLYTTGPTTSSWQNTFPHLVCSGCFECDVQILAAWYGLNVLISMPSSQPPMNTTPPPTSYYGRDFLTLMYAWYVVSTGVIRPPSFTTPQSRLEDPD